MEETNSLARSRRMGEMPEGKLLLSMAVPMMLSMLVQALYNIVDSVYVAKVSEDCLSALSLAFPAQNILIGLATGTGVGVSTMLSRALGSRDNKLANRVAGNSLFLCVCCWIIMAIFGIFFADAFIHSQTDIESIRSYGDSYLRIVTIGSVFVYFEINFERLLQSTGQTKLSMWAQIIGAVANIILDPFFIYGWFALAGFLFHLKHNKEVNIRLSDCRPDGHIILDIYRIGFPSILMVGIGSLTNYLMNRILMAFTSTAVALYGAYFKLQSFFFMPVFGLNNGIVPIVGYNYGARKKERIYRTIRYGVLYAVCILAIGLLLFEAIPGVLLQAFSPSEHMLAIGIPALRKIAIHFPIAAFCIVGGSVCQALGKSLYSFFTSVLRQVVALIPAAYLLSLTGNVGNVWWCFPIAEVVSACATAFFLRRALRNMDRELTLAEGQ